jgi:hypothetical protein
MVRLSSTATEWSECRWRCLNVPVLSNSRRSALTILYAAKKRDEIGFRVSHFHAMPQSWPIGRIALAADFVELSSNVLIRIGQTRATLVSRHSLDAKVAAPDLRQFTTAA